MTLAWEQPSPWPRVLWCVAVTFSRDLGVRMHINERGVARQLLCRFVHSSSYYYHLKKHKGDRPYKCTFCSKSFYNSTQQKCHLRIHTGKCHLRIHTGNCHLRIHTGKCHLRIHTGKCHVRIHTGKCHLRIHTGKCHLRIRTGKCRLTGKCPLRIHTGECHLRIHTGKCHLRIHTGKCHLRMSSKNTHR